MRSVSLLLALCNIGYWVVTLAQKELQNSTTLRYMSLPPPLPQIVCGHSLIPIDSKRNQHSEPTDFNGKYWSLLKADSQAYCAGSNWACHVTWATCMSSSSCAEWNLNISLPNLTEMEGVSISCPWTSSRINFMKLLRGHNIRYKVMEPFIHCRVSLEINNG